MWAVLGLLVALISASRLALHVHYPSDVIVGLLLGVVFAALATLDWRRPGVLAANLWLPAVVLIIACLLPVSLPEEYSRGLGMLAGFWLAEPRYLPPSHLGRARRRGRDRADHRDRGLPGPERPGRAAAHSLSSAARAVRYFLLVLVAVWGVPALLKVWLRPPRR